MRARLIRGGGAAVTLLVGGLVSLLVVGCGSNPATSSTESPDPAGAGAPGEPVSATTQADGVLVTLAISSDEVVAGDRIRIRISALNAGLGPAAYESGGCGPIMRIGVNGPPLEPRAVTPPAGVGADGALALAKWSALSQGGTQLDTIRTREMADDAFMACPADLSYEDIGPGETLSDEAVWIARIADGAPAPAGAYVVELAFPHAGRRAKEDVPFEGEVVTPITVAVPLTVLPGPKVVVDAEAAIDAAIEDAAVLAWAERTLKREGLEGATITLTEGRWRWRIAYVGGEAEIFIDPATGMVVESRL